MNFIYASMVGFGTCSTQYGLKYKKVHFREASKSKMNILKTKFRIDWSRTLVALKKKIQKTLILAFEVIVHSYKHTCHCIFRALTIVAIVENISML